MQKRDFLILLIFLLLLIIYIVFAPITVNRVAINSSTGGVNVVLYRNDTLFAGTNVTLNSADGEYVFFKWFNNDSATSNTTTGRMQAVLATNNTFTNTTNRDISDIIKARRYYVQVIVNDSGTNSTGTNVTTVLPAPVKNSMSTITTDITFGNYTNSSANVFVNYSDPDGASDLSSCRVYVKNMTVTGFEAGKAGSLSTGNCTFLLDFVGGGYLPLRTLNLTLEVTDGTAILNSTSANSTIPDPIAPWSANITQRTANLITGQSNEFKAQGKDYGLLAYAILSTNESGLNNTYRNFTNDRALYGSPVNLGETRDAYNFSNFTWDGSAGIPAGTTISWLVWYNDTAGNYNKTSLTNFTIIAGSIPSGASGSGRRRGTSSTSTQTLSTSGTIFTLNENSNIVIPFGNELYTLNLKSIDVDNNKATFILKSAEPYLFDVYLQQESFIDLNNDYIEDISMILDNIINSGRIQFSVYLLTATTPSNEQILEFPIETPPAEEVAIPPRPERISQEIISEKPNKKIGYAVIGLLFLMIVALSYTIYNLVYKKNQ